MATEFCMVVLIVRVLSMSPFRCLDLWGGSTDF